jgi:hypothetical protein
MVKLKIDNEEFRGPIYNYIFAMQIQLSLYVCSSINNELAHDVKVDFFKDPFQLEKEDFFLSV